MDVKAEIRGILKKEAQHLEDVPDSAKLTDLGLDSLSVIEIIFAIEDKFRIQVQPSNEQVAAMTFSDLCEFVELQRQEVGNSSPSSSSP